MEMTEQEREEYYQKLMDYINNARGLPKYTGMTITKIEPNYCEGELRISPDVCNYLGVVHGGCLAALADSVAGIAAVSSGRGTVTLSYGFNFLRQARGTKIRCIAQPEKVGRQISTFHCTLYDDADSLVASGLFTFYMTDPMDGDHVGV